MADLDILDERGRYISKLPDVVSDEDAALLQEESDRDPFLLFKILEVLARRTNGSVFSVSTESGSFPGDQWGGLQIGQRRFLKDEIQNILAVQLSAAYAQLQIDPSGIKAPVTIQGVSLLFNRDDFVAALAPLLRSRLDAIQKAFPAFAPPTPAPTPHP